MDFSHTLVKISSPPRLLSRLAHLHGRSELIFHLVLRFDLLGHYARGLKCKNLFVYSEKQHDPIIAVRPVIYLPLFALCVPLMTATHSSCDFFLGQRPRYLLIAYETSA